METEMRVPTCGDCIHADACECNPSIPFFDRANVAFCDGFKDKHNFVEVCRCKDCKHMEKTPDGLRWCHVWAGINGMGDDGFCNYGERKDNERKAD